MADAEQMIFPGFPPPDPPHPLAGKPYKPARSEEWGGFECKFCDHCNVEPEIWGTCWLADSVEMSDVSDADFPEEFTHDYRGRPICTAFEERDDG